jgi:tRNA A37 threonylcarbamoyladenosine dehydratase
MPGNSSGSERWPARFGRVVDLYGEEAFARIRAGRVAVLGLGGVGSHAAVCLARSGVGGLRLVDFDTVTASSLNRNPVAGPADVGRPKVDVVAEHLARVCPDTAVATSTAFCHADTLDDLLAPPPDVVADAIDSLTPKAALLEHCVRRGLAVVSSMGASSRTDPTLVRVGDLAGTAVCPLARKLKQYLRKRGIAGGITCVWSLEQPVAPLPPALEDRTCDRGRVRNRLPSQMSLPGIFGYALALLALDRLAGRPR